MTLAELGWTPSWAAAAGALDGLDVVRVVVEHRGAYHVAGDGGGGWAELPGRTFRSARDKRDLPTVGDWVVVEGWAAAREGGGAARIVRVVPRRSLLVRRAAGERTVPQPLAANVDLGLIVTSANLDLSTRRLERYLAVIREAEVTPVVVLSKIDLTADPDAVVAAVAAVAAGAAVVSTSAVDGAGVAALRALTAGKTSVLLGSSGVGKSTLLNCLLADARQLTQPVRADDDRGRHTTTRRELFVTAEGAIVIDTPGMRELAAWAEADADTAGVVADGALATLAAQCRFRDCGHDGEPGCALRAAIAAGTLDPARLDHVRKLTSERDAGAARHDAAARREALRRAKLATRAARDVQRRKDHKP